MSTDLEDEIRDALRGRGQSVTGATLRRSMYPAGASASLGDLVLADIQLFSKELKGERRRSRRQRGGWLSVAATVTMLIGVLGLVATLSLTGSSEPSGSGPYSGGQLLRSLHFAIDLPAGAKITQVDSFADGSQDAHIALGNHDAVLLTVDPTAGVNRRFRSDAQPTTVAGRPGFVGATWTDPQYDTNNTDLPTNVSWKYNATAYAVLSADGATAPVAVLMDFAQRIGFSEDTPIHVAMSLGALPTGVSPAEILSTYSAAADSAYPWDSTVILGLATSENDAIRVDVCRCSASAADRAKAQTQAVNGHTAYLYSKGAGGGQLEVDEGGGVVLIVESQHSDAGRWTGTLTQLRGIAAATTVTPAPTLPANWFDAVSAIP